MSETLGTLTDTILTRLGDANNVVWTRAEIQRYVKEGYDILCMDTEVLWEREFLEDEVFTGTHVGDWEIQYMDYYYNRFNITGGTWEEKYVENDIPTQVANHTAQWEWANDYVDAEFVTGLHVLPENLYKVERVTWDDRRIFPLLPRQLEEMDPQYEIKTGPPIAYMMGRDGLRHLRTYPHSSAASATAVSGSWGLPRDVSDASSATVYGSWGTIREFSGVFISGSEQWGKPVGFQASTLNLLIEYFRRGNELSEEDSQFEISDRYVRYIRDYAQAKALTRESPGQDHKLGNFFWERWQLEKERLRVRRHYSNRGKTRVMGGTEPRLTRPPRPRLPYHYPRLRG